MKWLRNLFKTNVTQNSPYDEKTALKWKGFDFYVVGKENYLKRNSEEALRNFDLAVEQGFIGNFKSELLNFYDMRGRCLQELEYHYAAITDFDVTIDLSPDDANGYYSRSLSKSAILDHNGAVIDLEKAVSLSKRRNELNHAYDNEAQKMGHESAEEMFKSWLLRAQLRLQIEKAEQDIINKSSPELKDDLKRAANEQRQKILSSIKMRP